MSLDEAEAFLADRWLLTRTPDCALPSLYEACHEDPYRPGSPGFASWPATKWPWFGQLAGRGYLVTALHKGKNLILSADGARLVDPICRAEITRMRAEDPGSRRLLDHLDAAGPAMVDDLIAELRMQRQELNALRSPLERCGAIVSRSVELTSAHGQAQGRELVRLGSRLPGAARRRCHPRAGARRSRGRGGQRRGAGARARGAALVLLDLVPDGYVHRRSRRPGPAAPGRRRAGHRRVSGARRRLLAEGRGEDASEIVAIPAAWILGRVVAADREADEPVVARRSG